MLFAILREFYEKEGFGAKPQTPYEGFFPENSLKKMQKAFLNSVISTTCKLGKRLSGVIRRLAEKDKGLTRGLLLGFPFGGSLAAPDDIAV